MTPELLKSDAPFKRNTQNKILGDTQNENLFCLSVYQLNPKRYLRVLKILDGAK